MIELTENEKKVKAAIVNQEFADSLAKSGGWKVTIISASSGEVIKSEPKND